MSTPQEYRRVADELAALRTKLRQAIETEWYNGNLTGPAAGRLDALLDPQ